MLLGEKIPALPEEVSSLLLEVGSLGDLLGINVYIAGGIVRDIFLNRNYSNSIDLDIVVEGDSYFFAQKLSESLCSRVHIYKEFLTAIIFYKDKDSIEFRIDVASARSEVYPSPAALPVVRKASIDQDLFRRDFTINAMAIQLNKKCFGKLFDFFGGQNDIQKSVIQVLHPLSFIDDPTRIIRAIRFEQRYGFHISKYTELLIQEALSLGLIKQIEGKRFAHEFLLVFKERSPSNCLLRMDDLNVCSSIDNKLKKNLKKKIIYKTQKVLDWYVALGVDEVSPCVTNLYLLVLSRLCTNAEAKQLFETIGLSEDFQQSLLVQKKNIQRVLKALVLTSYRSKFEILKKSSLYAILVSVPLVYLLYFMVCISKENVIVILEQFICSWRFIKPDITGKDLKLMGFLPGPQYTKILQDVFKEKLDGNIQSKEEQIAYIYTHYNKDKM